LCFVINTGNEFLVGISIGIHICISLGICIGCSTGIHICVSICINVGISIRICHLYWL